jgi:hypothetical protein
MCYLRFPPAVHPQFCSKLAFTPGLAITRILPDLPRFNFTWATLPRVKADLDGGVTVILPGIFFP